MGHLQTPGLGQTPISRAPRGAVAAGPPPSPAPVGGRAVGAPPIQLKGADAPLGAYDEYTPEMLRRRVVLIQNLRHEGQTDAEISTLLQSLGAGDAGIRAAFEVADREEPSDETGGIPWMWIGIGVSALALIGGGFWWWRRRGAA